MNDEPKPAPSRRVPRRAPDPRAQRAAAGLDEDLQLCCAKLRAEGFDVVNANELLRQDAELVELRALAAERIGREVGAAELEEAGRAESAARELLGLLVVHLERLTLELERRAAATLIEDLDGELAFRGFTRATGTGLAVIRVDPSIRLDVGDRLRERDELERRVAELAEELVDAELEVTRLLRAAAVDELEAPK